MNKIALIFTMAIIAIGCKNDDDTTIDILGCTDSTSLNFNSAATVDDNSCIYPVPVSFNFTQNWDGNTIQNSDFENTTYTNAFGTQLTVSKLVYLISDITFTDSSGTVYDASDFNLIDSRQGTNLTFTPNIQIPPGDYAVSFTFGFNDEDNIDGAYPELNLTPEGPWGVPAALGGGYHYMRLEGKYTDMAAGQTGYAYHAIRANDTSMTPLLLQDTSFVVNLGQVTISDNTNIEVEMNIAEWFKNPNLWDLNVLFATLMPNFNAQVLMSENGEQGVFSLGAVTQ